MQGNGTSWHILRSHPRQEDVATRSLGREGFEVYFPKRHVFILPRRNRITSSRRHKLTPEPVLRALLPCYLFIRPAEPGTTTYYRIFDLAGVSGMVAFGEHLATLSEAAMARFRDDINGGRYDEHHETVAGHYRLGDRPTFISERFASVPLPSEVVGLDEGREYVHLLVNLFGRSIRVIATPDELRAAA